jgi:multidrug efflux pump subunit AcrA (membrane-fusion protein)
MNIVTLVRTYHKNLYVRAAAAVIITFIVAFSIRSLQTNDSTADVKENLPVVEVTSAASLAQGDSVSLIGTVRAFTEAQITSERSGRVTRVSATLGGTVSAGQVIATLENASEQAAVLQAQGAYEAALAAARQSSFSVGEAGTGVTAAENALITSLRSGYNQANATVINDIDAFFSSPDGTPGLRISGGDAPSINAVRVSFQSLLPTWRDRTNSLTNNSNLVAEASYTKENLNKTVQFLDTFLVIFSRYNADAYTDEEIEGFINSFTAKRALLLQAISAIEAAEAQLQNAKDNQARASLSASGSGASASDAQVKQALGSLRAAQANLAKTVLRSPIGGTVNSLDIKVGDFINSFDTVSVIANNNALEIVTFVGDLEKDQLVVGDTVFIENEFEGIITQIAPAVDQATKKTEVRIATDNTNIANGDTVRITKDAATTTIETEISVPITAVKFEAENGTVFTVVDGSLVARPVVIGKIRGTRVEILEGLTATDEFVIDARGLSAGARVEVKTK